MYTQVTFHCYNGVENKKPVKKMRGNVDDFNKNLNDLLADKSIDAFRCTFREGLKVGGVFIPLTEKYTDRLVYISSAENENPVMNRSETTGSCTSLWTDVITRLNNSEKFHTTHNIVINEEKKIITSPSIEWDKLKMKPGMAEAYGFASALGAITATKMQRKYRDFTEKYLSM